MATVKAGRNKTIDTPLSEGQIYLDRCIAVTQRQVGLGGVLDKTVICYWRYAGCMFIATSQEYRFDNCRPTV